MITKIIQRTAAIFAAYALLTSPALAQVEQDPLDTTSDAEVGAPYVQDSTGIDTEIESEDLAIEEEQSFGESLEEPEIYEEPGLYEEPGAIYEEPGLFEESELEYQQEYDPTLDSYGDEAEDLYYPAEEDLGETGVYEETE